MVRLFIQTVYLVRKGLVKYIFQNGVNFLSLVQGRECISCFIQKYNMSTHEEWTSLTVTRSSCNLQGTRIFSATDRRLSWRWIHTIHSDLILIRIYLDPETPWWELIIDVSTALKMKILFFGALKNIVSVRTLYAILNCIPFMFVKYLLSRIIFMCIWDFS